MFGALADPTRRQLLPTIAAAPGHRHRARRRAADLPPGGAQAPDALADAGLLERERAGREVRYRVTPAPLSDAVSWMAEVGGQWDERLARCSARSAASAPLG